MNLSNNSNIDGEAVAVLYFINLDTKIKPVSEQLVSLRYCSIRKIFSIFPYYAKAGQDDIIFFFWGGDLELMS